MSRAVDQGSLRSHLGMPSISSLLCRAGMGSAGDAADRLEAEAGVLRRRQCLELQIDEARHMCDARGVGRVSPMSIVSTSPSTR